MRSRHAGKPMVISRACFSSSGCPSAQAGRGRRNFFLAEVANEFAGA